MKNDLWHDCLVCENKTCCKSQITFPLFVTSEEKDISPAVNSKYPCAYLNDKDLCDIHPHRPIDCRLFPFDIMKTDNHYHWMIWNIDCPITKNKRADFEKFLTEHEEKLIPDFIQHLDDYAKFRLEELKNIYKYEILRKIKIKNL